MKYIEEMIMGQGTNDYIVVMFQIASHSMVGKELLDRGLHSPNASLV